MNKLFNLRLAMILGITAASMSTNAFESGRSLWQGDWRWDAKDQAGDEYGGNLTITNCNETGCAYDLYTGSVHAVCNSDGQFTFRSPSSAVHDRMGADLTGNSGSCLITFDIKEGEVLVTDSVGRGCSYFCGASANFGGDFHRISSTPIYRTSYNCLRAEQSLEMAICSNKILANLDLKLSQLYNTLKAALSADLQQQLRFEQQQWLKTRNQTCGDTTDMVDCLDNIYQERINELINLNNALLVEDKRSDENILDTFKIWAPDLYAVYNKELETDPGLSGEIIFKITISSKGNVSKTNLVRSSLKNESFISEISAIIYSMNFGPVKDEKEFTFMYPMRFDPK